MEFQAPGIVEKKPNLPPNTNESYLARMIIGLILLIGGFIWLVSFFMAGSKELEGSTGFFFGGAIFALGLFSLVIFCFQNFSRKASKYILALCLLLTIIIVFYFFQSSHS